MVFPRAAAHGYTRNREVYRWFRLPETLSTHLRVGSRESAAIQPTELLYIYSYEDHFSLPMVSAAVRKNACGAINGAEGAQKIGGHGMS